jgi:hypothetical protein
VHSLPLDPGSGKEKKQDPESRVDITDYISESLITFFEVKIIKILSFRSGYGIWCLFDPRSEVAKFGPGIQDLGPATMLLAGLFDI